MNAQQRGTEREGEVSKSPCFTLIPKETLEPLAVDFERELGRLAPLIFLDDPDIKKAKYRSVISLELFGLRVAGRGSSGYSG